MIYRLFLIFQNYPVSLTPEDAKRSLRNLAEHGTRILIAPPPKTPDLLIRIKNLSRGKSHCSCSVYYRD
jgi:hypothetical protein